ncbi:MAG: primosomal protein N' [Xanthomonadaceae bacterium]|nr:primosomal protein N' [Xanthomonadaceae bacterium]
MNSEIVQVAIPVPVYRLFDYLVPAQQPSPARGSRVLVPFGQRMRVGLVVSTNADSKAEPASLKRIESVLDDSLVPQELLDLLVWTADYYAAPPGEVVGHALPSVLRKPVPSRALAKTWLKMTEIGIRADFSRAPRQQQIAQSLQSGPLRRTELAAQGVSSEAVRRMLDAGTIEACLPPHSQAIPGPELNAEQRRAVAAILGARRHFQAFALAGVTGSGKTEVYLQAARHLLQRNRQILVLLPEIGLTPQFVRRLEARLGRPAWAYHSGLSETERLNTWQAARSGQAELLVGTRSAVFLPLSRPGLIVVDEEHDSSFKQFDGMRYHGRDVAVLRASRLNIPIVLGSATPSLETLLNVERGRYRLIELPNRVGTTRQPKWQVLDVRGQTFEDGLTQELRQRIETRLKAGQQVLIYRNRRGFAPILMCNECGWQGDCERCSAHLTWHRSAGQLRCHHCGFSRPVPARCPDCQSPDLQALGEGTQRIEAALKARFGDYPVYRIDRDNIRGREDFEAALSIIAKREPCILVGTQMLAKGHHLPGIGLAIMLDADQLLFSADFRAAERLAQSVIQVAGRAGRDQPGEFILPSRHPEHPMIQLLAKGNYLRSAGLLLDERRSTELPPCWNLAMIRAEAAETATAVEFLNRVRQLIADPSLRIGGPLAAILQRRAGFWRFQLWLMSRSKAAIRIELQTLIPRIKRLRGAHRVRWHIDVDPIEM